MEKLSQFCALLIFLAKQCAGDSECSLPEFKCGDLCIPRSSECYCGTDEPSTNYWEGKTINFDDFERGDRCWLTSDDDACYQENGHGFCVNGTRDGIQICGDIEMEKSKSCNGTCSDAGLFACATPGDNCVDHKALCHGYSVCNDKSDLKFCNEQPCHQYRLYTSIGAVSTSIKLFKCEDDLKLPTEHSECYLPTRDDEDGVFNCLGRQDENITLAWKDAEEIVKYEDLKLCEDETGSGIQCGSECVLMDTWCTGETNRYSCTIINSPQLCGNYTFWKEKDCGKLKSRCTGKSQQCFLPDYSNVETNGGEWEIESTCVNNFMSLGWIAYRLSGAVSVDCPDKSDQVFPMNSICTHDTYVDIICDDMYRNEDKCYQDQNGIGNCTTNTTPYQSCSPKEFRCGDICIPESKSCYCGSDDVGYWRWGKFICLPGSQNETCYQENGNGFCVGGRKIPQIDYDLLKICKNRTIPCSEGKNYYRADHHNCKGSCAVPGPNCQACTNPDYFNCTKSGKCVHPSLVCDGHPQCEEAEDEDLDICYDKHVENGDIKGTATLVCLSIMYPKMLTVATVCDGIVECDGGRDENWICRSNKIIFYGVLFFCFLILSFVFASKWFRQKKFKREALNTNSSLPLQNDEKMFLKNHGQQKFKNSINVILKRSKLLDHKDERILRNKEYYNLELGVHGGDVANTKCCIKNYLDPSIFKTVVEDMEPGLIRTFTPWLETYLEKFDEQKWMRWLLRKVKEISTIYIDLSKDSLLVFSIIMAIGGISSLIDFPTKLTSIVVFCFLVSILFPLLMCSLILAEETIDGSTVSLSWKEKIHIFLKLILLSFLNPMILIDEYETNKEKLDEAVRTIRDEKDVENVLKLQRKAQSLKTKYVNFVRIDLQLETMFQTAGQILLLLLTITKTSTTGGLEKIFETTSIFYLVISIGWSVKTCFMEHLKSKTLEKPFMMFTSKMVVLLSAVCVAIKRILVLVFFFVPAFGLLDLLYHWKYEQTPFAVSLSGKMTKNDTLYLHNSDPLPWVHVDRWIYADPEYEEWRGEKEFRRFNTSTPPPYTLYTGLSLGQYFILFWVILAVHTIVIAFTKWFMSEAYRKTTYLKMFVHALENVNFPSAFLDWDTLHGTIQEHRDRLQRVTKEVTTVMVVNFIFNLLLLIPMFYTVTNIWERHEILGRTIGTKDEENISNNNASFWLTAVTTLYFLLSIMELCLYLFYNYKAHPWKDIIQEDTNKMSSVVKEGKVNPEIEEIDNSDKSTGRLGENLTDQKQQEASQLYVLNIRITKRVDR